VPEVAKAYVRYIEAMSRAVGKFVMYLIFVMMGVLLNEAIFRTFFNAPRIWSVELGQFFLTAFYMLGGAYVLLIEGHVRMDAFYGRWSEKRKAITNVMTFCIFAVYFVVLLIYGIRSAEYAVVFGQHSRTIWHPIVAPIKIIMVIGITLLFLQGVALFIKNLAIARGKPLT